MKIATATVGVLMLGATLVPAPVQAQTPVPEPSVGSCYTRLPSDGWDFNAVAGSQTACTSPHIFEVLSVFAPPAISGTAAAQVDRRRLFTLTSCAAEVNSSIGLTSSASHYALEVLTATGETRGICGVVALGKRPDVPIATTVPYASADLTAPLCMTGLGGFVNCAARKAVARVDSAAVFYPLTSITDGMAFPGRKATTKRAKRIAKQLDHPRDYHFLAPRTKKLWRSTVRMVYVYHRR